MPLFKIQHITKYIYDNQIRESANLIKIYPLSSGSSLNSKKGQEVLSFSLDVTHHPAIHKFDDYWGNATGVFMVNEPHTEFVIDCQMTVKTDPSVENPLAYSKYAHWQTIKEAVKKDIKLLDLSKIEKIDQQETIASLVSDLFHPKDSPAIFTQKCAEFIFNEFSYQKGITTVDTRIDEILAHKSGVCQDFAHVMLQMLRTVGLPARYVSGYICPNKDGARGAGATHAWVEIWLYEIGWVGIDPTNNIWVSDRHVALATGRYFEDCSPVKGTFKGAANQELYVYVSVGYEDGFVFEDQNEIVLTKEPTQPLIPSQQQ